jgi:hypothetical protein
MKKIIELNLLYCSSIYDGKQKVFLFDFEEKQTQTNWLGVAAWFAFLKKKLSFWIRFLRN